MPSSRMICRSCIAHRPAPRSRQCADRSTAGTDIKEMSDAKAAILKTTIMRNRAAQIARANNGNHPLLIDLQDILQLVDKEIDLIARALLAEAAKVGEILANLRRTDVQPRLPNSCDDVTCLSSCCRRRSARRYKGNRPMTISGMDRRCLTRALKQDSSEADCETLYNYHRTTPPPSTLADSCRRMRAAHRASRLASAPRL